MDATTYSVAEVAALSGLSVRALHHYEDVGLLKPARKANGYRAYTHDDVRRLQQVMLFRACGMHLSRIVEVMDDPAYSPHDALLAHVDVLRRQRRDLDELIATVEKTIQELEGTNEMTDEQRFAGLKRRAVEENERTYGAEARARFGDEAVDAANDALLQMNEREWSDMNELEIAVIEQLKNAMLDGDSTGEAASALVDMHAQWIAMHWGPGRYTPQAHVMLAKGYLADERFVQYYDSRAGEGATRFLVAAVEARLAG